MGPWGYILTAHLITWSAIGFYLFFLKRRSRQLDQQLAARRRRPRQSEI